MSDMIRYVLIGAGGIAQSYIQAFEKTRHSKLVGIVDVRPEAAKASAEHAKCRGFSTLGEMLECGVDFDAGIICTPPVSHENIALDLIAAGKHVLCEKPFMLTSESARKVIAAAHDAGVTITMASKFRHVDDVIRAKAIAMSGILGEVILFENAFTARADMSNRWNSNPLVSGGGVLIDNGTHSVDLMRYFLGPLIDVHVLEGKRVQNLAVEDSVRVFVKSQEGVMGSIDLSWSINKELESYINIYGSRGTISIGWKESKYRQEGNREWIVFGTGYNKTQAFTGILDRFSRFLIMHEPLLISHHDALASVEMIEAAYRSMEQCSWTHVDHGSVF